MAPDRYTALWISHSQISDFLACPRAYFLKNVYKDPKTGRRISLMSPPLALGSAVHEVVESLSTLSAKDRFREALVPKFEQVWEKYQGKKGGFFDLDAERKYQERGRGMLRRLELNPGPLVNLAVKLSAEIPYYWLSEEDNIILCGRIDWLEYLPDTDAVHIIDFKTSKSEEDPESLQLPIYALLAGKIQSRPVEKVSYWYLEMSDDLVSPQLPDLDEAEARVLQLAKKIKLARQLEKFSCPQGGCRACRPLEAVLAGEAEMVDSTKRGDIYVLPPKSDAEPESVIL
jgi:ATP-dependent helicase/DNAse subunit B